MFRSENEIIEKGYKQLTAKEIREKILNRTVWGDYYTGRIYVTYFGQDGKMQGINDLGTLSNGVYEINESKSTFAVDWDTYWDTWTGNLYEVDGKIYLFDSTEGYWRSTLNIIEEGQKELVLKQVNCTIEKEIMNEREKALKKAGIDS